MKKKRTETINKNDATNTHKRSERYGRVHVRANRDHAGTPKNRKSDTP